MNAAQAYNWFWSSFEWSAYDPSTVPDEADRKEKHYITYETAKSDLGEPVALSASLWSRSTSWAAISEKADEIYRHIGWGGVYIHFDGGYLWIKRGSPFAQRLPGEDDAIRRIVLNVEVDFITG